MKHTLPHLPRSKPKTVLTILNTCREEQSDRPIFATFRRPWSAQELKSIIPKKSLISFTAKNTHMISEYWSYSFRFGLRKVPSQNLGERTQLKIADPSPTATTCWRHVKVGELHFLAPSFEPLQPRSGFPASVVFRPSSPVTVIAFRYQPQSCARMDRSFLLGGH